MDIRDIRPDDWQQIVLLAEGLPDYFDEAGLTSIRQDIQVHSGLVAQESGRIVGFVTWKYHYPTSAEISWVAVARDRQGQGVGTRLITSMENRFQEGGTVRVVYVKTLAETVDYEPYRLTREFYEKQGFIPLGIFPTLWNEQSPAKIYVKFVGCAFP